MLPWKDLLQDAKYIEPRTNNSNPIDFPTSECIMKFLREHANSPRTSKGSNSTVDMLDC